MEGTVLTHWGIKGQKWGVRRYQNKNGSLTPAGKKRYSDEYHEDYKKAHQPKSVKTMSDKELRERLNRLNMEKQYSQLSTSTVSKGKKTVDSIIKIGTTTAAATTTAITLYNNAGKIRDIISSMTKK